MLLDARQNELVKTENAIFQAKQQEAAVHASVDQLHQEQSGLQATIQELKKHIADDLEIIDAGAKEAMERINQGLTVAMQGGLEQVDLLKTRALELGKEMGGIETAIASNEWIRTMHALVGGEYGASPGQVRAVALAVLRPTLLWIESRYQDDVSAALPRASLANAVIGMEQWIPKSTSTTGRP